MLYPTSVMDSCTLNQSMGAILLEASHFHGEDISEINFIAEMLKSCLTSILSLLSIKKIKSLKTATKTTLITILNVILATLFYALLAAVLFPFALLKTSVKIWFSIHGPKYELMNGADSFWSLEESTARPIINILCLLQLDHDKSENTNLFELIKDLIKSRLTKDVHFKLWSSREVTKTGYFYWKKDVFSVNDVVHLIEQDVTTRDSLEMYLSDIANKGFSAGFEVIVGEQPLLDDNSWPVIFRVHHSVGDGVSLVNALVSSLSDRSSVKLEAILNRRETSCSNSRLEGNAQNIPFTFNQLVGGPNLILKRIFNQKELGSLSDKKLSGKKNVLWFFDSSGEILRKIKSVKTSKRVRFSEVIFSVLSDSLEGFYSERGSVVKDVPVVVPIVNSKRIFVKNTYLNDKGFKITKVTLANKLSNNFSVSLVQLPIQKGSEIKLDKVKNAFQESTFSGEIQLFSFLVDVVSSLMPKTIIQPLFGLVKSSIVFSNLPGPSEQISLANNIIKDIAFWLPNRSDNGLGLSVLSYCSMLSFGIIADESVFCKQQLKTLFENFISSLENMK